MGVRAFDNTQNTFNCCRYPEILNELLTRLGEYNQTAVPPANLPLDPNADPRFFDNTWTNFADFSNMKYHN